MHLHGTRSSSRDKWMGGQTVCVILISASLAIGSDGCSLRDITDLSVIGDGVVQVLLPEKQCHFEIDALTIDDELSYLPKSLKVPDCTNILVISELRGQGILVRVPRKHSGTETIYNSLITKPASTTENAGICRGDVSEAAELRTPFTYQGDHAHPPKAYISQGYSWSSRIQFCNDKKIEPTSCSNDSCRVSQCLRVVIPDTTFLYTGYHEVTCNAHSNNTVCEAVHTHAHFNGTEWYRHDVARQCVVVADTKQCLPNCNLLYNTTENSTVFCNFTSGQCRLSADQTSLALPSKPTRPSLYENSPRSLTLSFSVKFGSARINYYLLTIVNVSTTNATNTTDLSYTLINVTSGDVRYLTQEEEIVEGEGEEEEVVGYEVRLKVEDLEQGEKYVFTVAAGSSIGVGDFSEPSDPYSLKNDIPIHHNDSGIPVAAIVVLLVAGLILLVTVLLVILALAHAVIKRRREE